MIIVSPRITFAPWLVKKLIVGSASRMRVSSVILVWSALLNGTLKSTRTRTFASFKRFGLDLASCSIVFLYWLKALERKRSRYRCCNGSASKSIKHRSAEILSFDLSGYMHQISLGDNIHLFINFKVGTCVAYHFLKF